MLGQQEKVGELDGKFTWWRSVGVLVLGLLQGAQQLFDLVGKVGLLDQVFSRLVTRGALKIHTNTH